MWFSYANNSTTYTLKEGETPRERQDGTEYSLVKRYFQIYDHNKKESFAVKVVKRIWYKFFWRRPVIGAEEEDAARQQELERGPDGKSYRLVWVAKTPFAKYEIRLRPLKVTGRTRSQNVEAHKDVDADGDQSGDIFEVVEALDLFAMISSRTGEVSNITV